jgi:2,4-dienoyl-CoA reductase-like NADH-dependent reductase (Old Yellow Enzyme family)
MYRYLFSPIRINQLEIKNRIAYPALWAGSFTAFHQLIIMILQAAS